VFTVRARRPICILALALVVLVIFEDALFRIILNVGSFLSEFENVLDLDESKFRFDLDKTTIRLISVFSMNIFET
jgi:hypothetical protein